LDNWNNTKDFSSDFTNKSESSNVIPNYPKDKLDKKELNSANYAEKAVKHSNKLKYL